MVWRLGAMPFHRLLWIQMAVCAFLDWMNLMMGNIKFA